ncbi:MAG TPA: hypothetical protein VKM93_03130 [Terriglobia bacterium]|nr:hypothetical protein [Terriglobia bacterium]
MSEADSRFSEKGAASPIALITVPAVITLAITILRLVGELQHWPAPWFSAAAGGGGAVVGISWLPIIFGPYFAWKLAAAGQGPASAGKSIGAALAGLAVMVLGGFIEFPKPGNPPSPVLFLVGSLIMLVGAFVPRLGWKALGNTLLAYALAARIPVVIIMFIAMNGNGGQGWGTHYDVAPPYMAGVSVLHKWLEIGVLPQMTFWIGWTTVIGGLLGSIVVAVARPGKKAADATA